VTEMSFALERDLFSLDNAVSDLGRALRKIVSDPVKSNAFRTRIEAIVNEARAEAVKQGAKVG
jgi:hypothetical protein